MAGRPGLSLDRLDKNALSKTLAAAEKTEMRIQESGDDPTVPGYISRVESALIHLSISPQVCHSNIRTSQ